MDGSDQRGCSDSRISGTHVNPGVSGSTPHNSRRIALIPVVPGDAHGTLSVSAVPLSFWGGFDPASGKVMDVHHDLCGQSLAGRVLVMPFSRGSSSSSGVLLESIRLRTCPAAIITQTAEPILAIASIIARELYGRWVPVATVSKDDMALLQNGCAVDVRISHDAGEMLIQEGT